MLLKENAIRIERTKQKSKSTYATYIFICSECPNEIKAQSSALKKHSGKCRRCVQLGEPYKAIYNELKCHGTRGIEFNLSFEEFLELINNPICHYCNSNIIYNPHTRFWGKNLNRAYQLDRKNNKIGYIKENLVVCCWECNRLKSDRFSYEEFMLLSPIMIQIMKNRKI
jgi:hypothetical protein